MTTDVGVNINRQHVTTSASVKTFIKNRYPRTHKVLRKLYRLPSDYWKPKSGNIVALLEQLCARNLRPLFFIQIGANNGNDEFKDLRQSYGWKGIMVEPQQDVFAELIRSNPESGLTFERVAISDRERELPLYKISFSRADWAHTLASFDRKVLERSIRDGWVSRCAAAEGITPPKSIEDWIEVEVVRCITLKQLLAEHQITDFDLLILDTEGHDYEIVKQVGQLERRPRAIVFEHKLLPTRTLKTAVSLLRSWGYSLTADDSNTLCVRNIGI